MSRKTEEIQYCVRVPQWGIHNKCPEKPRKFNTLWGSHNGGYTTNVPKNKGNSILCMGSHNGGYTTNVPKNRGNSILCEGSHNEGYTTNVPKNKGNSVLCEVSHNGGYTTDVPKNRGNSILCGGPTMRDTQQMFRKTMEIQYFVTVLQCGIHNNCPEKQRKFNTV